MLVMFCCIKHSSHPKVSIPIVIITTNMKTTEIIFTVDVALSSVLFVLIIKKDPIPNNIANIGRSILLLPKSVSPILT